MMKRAATCMPPWGPFKKGEPGTGIAVLCMLPPKQKRKHPYTEDCLNAILVYIILAATSNSDQITVDIFCFIDP